MAKRELGEVKRIVVKVGTSTLTYENGEIHLSRMEKLVRVLADLMNAGYEVVLVSSGAIQFGVKKLKLSARPEKMREKQAVASVGQSELMHIYSKLFGEYHHTVGQVLLTRDVVDDDHVCNNVINTFKTLFEFKVLPIVNENDTVSIDEIENIVRFGDNDQLSAIVATLINADLLIILSDVDGFYNNDPIKYEDSELMSEITCVTGEIEKFAGDTQTIMGTGGMVTKLAAAKIVTNHGIHMVLANGKEPSILLDVIEGNEIGTIFKKRSDCNDNS